MARQSALRRMSAEKRYVIFDIFLAYFAMGIYLMLIGSALPSIKAEYGISYRIGGLMMSVQQAGYVVTGLLIGVLAQRFGVRRVYLALGFSAFLGLALIMLTGNPAVLLFAMLLTGVSKGSSCSIGNQVSSVLSGNDTGLLNLTQAFLAVGACIAPLISLLCGASWRMAFAISIAAGAVTLLHGLRARMEQDAFARADSAMDLRFMKTGLFWLCAMILMCYIAVEVSVMGWLVTYFVDSGAADETTAQLLATALWGALLAGRFASAWLSARFAPQHMLAVMTVGVTVSFTGLMFSQTLVPMALSTMGLGLFAAGMYGTTLGASEGMLERFPMCVGMFIAIPGAGAAVTQSAVGALADRFGIRGGMLFLYVLLAILAAAVLLLLRYKRRGGAG